MSVGLRTGISADGCYIGKRYYIEDKEVMRTLMHGLRDKALPHLSDWIHFEELLITRSLVPGERPRPFAYSEEILAAAGLRPDPSPPGLDQLKGLALLSTRTGWWGKFFPDGSAQIIYSPDDWFSAPGQGFSFAEVYSLLLPHLKHGDNYDYDETLSVRLYVGDSVRRFYIEDKEIMRTLMHGLRDKVVPVSHLMGYFEKVLSEHPLVPGDAPAPFAFSDEARANAARAKAKADEEERVKNEKAREEYLKRHSRPPPAAPQPETPGNAGKGRAP
jgi:hypothetical protein